MFVVAPPAGDEPVLKYSGLFQYLPAAGTWGVIPNTAFATWTDGCDGTSGDNSGTPCTSTGGLIRTTDAEAAAIDSNIGPGNYGSNDVMVLWNGAGRDEVNGCMYLFGGGHEKWYGNEVYQLCLAGPNGPVLTRLNDPAPLTDTVGGNNIHPTAGPMAVHSYSGVQFIPERREFVVMQNGVVSNGAGGVENSLPGFFDVDRRQWLDPRHG